LSNITITKKKVTAQNILSASYEFNKVITVIKNEPISQSSSKVLEELTCEIVRINVTLTQFENTKFKNKIFNDYRLSLRIASHLAMVSKCARGNEARDYFYECEQQLIKLTESNLKLCSMLLTHKDKLNLTKVTARNK